LSAQPLSDADCQAALDAFAEHGTVTAAAEAMGLKRGTFQHRLNEARLRQSGMIVTGRSTLTDLRTGEPVMEWVKESLDRQKAAEAQRAAYAVLAAELPRIAPVAAPRATEGHLCTVYTITDYHLGALCWREEGGADWDLKIAEETLEGAFSALIAQSPVAHTGVVNVQGDFLHVDGFLPLTPASKHVLDADSRFPKVAAVAVRCIRRMVETALAKHASVILLVEEGNHDESSTIWLRIMFAALYENEPRVSVITSPLPFHVIQWGKTMLGFHHGHKVKNEQLPLLFAAQFPEIWGTTKRREIHCGHRHHRDEKEYNGVTVVQHPTLAARDAYAARGGWIADRAAQSITYHREYGQVGRVSVTPEMLQ
jgi:hypothetical protein